MAAAATPYVGWLSSAAAQAQLSAGQARAAATAFETALTATVHPAAVTSNRVSLLSLVQTNFLGLNTPAIFANEFDYVEMWAQDVAAMVGYQGGATAVAESLTPFGALPVDLPGVAGIGAEFASLATQVSAAVSPLAEGALAASSAAVAGVQSLAAAVPVQSLMSVAQLGAMPVSMLMGPLMQSANAGTAGAAGLASATEGLADAPKFVGDVAPAMTGLGGGAGLGDGMAGDLGKAHLVGAMSVPPTWQGSVPKGMSSSAMAGLGEMPNLAAMAQAGGTGSGMGMMPMPMGMGGGAGAGMPGGMTGRGGAGANVVQNRPSVIPRTGVG
jgi:PPE-repeat protein